MAARKTSKTMNFEEGLSRLEGIIDQLTRDELPLDELMKLYEEGVKLSDELTSKLDAAHGKMLEVTAGKNGEPTLAETDVIEQVSMLDQTE